MGRQLLERMSDAQPARSKAWRWGVCLLLLAATSINYMDRVTLATAAGRIKAEFGLTHEQYGQVEGGFSYAFAVGSLVFGVLADRINVRNLYPVVLLLWSVAGFASGLSGSYPELLICRTLLGLFEAGHWPCALKTIHRILEPRDRALGNGLLQGGASIGAILTPMLLQASFDLGKGWRLPFQMLGLAGLGWILFWHLTIRSSDLAAPPAAGSGKTSGREFLDAVLSRRFGALLIMISLINSTWQLLRAWLPLFLQEGRAYQEAEANWFTSAYYGATDAGVLTAGFVALRLVRAGKSIHTSRVLVFAGMSALAMLTLLAGNLPKGLPLLGILLLVGFGALGVFPCYYSFAQEMPAAHIGKINGILATCGWLVTGRIQELFGSMVDRRQSYDLGVAIAGCAPSLALVLFLVLWTRDPVERRIS
ncbi:MAG TPA: MFS transporter [Planctomycetota bacterium]|nr:MFS transporter [Planctomycetota bacterium]